MTGWLIGYSVSVMCFLLAYVLQQPTLADAPLALMFGLMLLTAVRWLSFNGLRIAPTIRLAFGVNMMLAAFLVAKHVFLSGGELALLIKLMGYHLIFASGLLIGFYEPPAMRQVDVLGFVVLFILPMAFFVIFARGEPPNQIVTFFNRNAFAAYLMTASTFMLGLASARPLLGPFGAVGVLLACLVINTTLGALLAVVLATGFYVLPNILGWLRHQALLVFMGGLGLVSAVLILLLSESYQGLQVYYRIDFVYNTAINIWNGYSGPLVDLDLVTAVGYAADGDLDMSAFFRIIHWIDIVRTAQDSGANLITGAGTDWIEQNLSAFVIPRAAHNDWLRFIIEQGFIVAITSITAVLVVIWNIRRSPMFVPLLAGALYFGTENLLNNFVATSFYFFVLAHVFARLRRVAWKSAQKDQVVTPLQVGATT